MKPVSIVIAVTYGCNSRCLTCDIWQMERGQELDPGSYERLPASLRYINISGGEPFMREDLFDVVSVIKRRCPESHIIISTNGLLPDRVERMMKKMTWVGVRVSLDAVGSEDDRVRGIPGSFEKAMQTIDVLRGIGVEDLGVSATISRHNPGGALAVKKYAERENLEFSSVVAHSGPLYFGDKRGSSPDPEVAERELLEIRNNELSSMNVKAWFRAYYTDGLIDYAKGLPRRIRCYGGRIAIYLTPGGDVYPCNILPDRMGNILEDSYETIASHSKAIFEKVDSCPVQCWMSCTVAPVMRLNPFKPLLWALRTKFFGRNGYEAWRESQAPEENHVHTGG
ncbi:MAG: radical SAM protein [Candidatus Eisenbacteria bacterium]|nr:radical SAM protein [Candidatus Eisenbacteria bacterium]